MDRAIAGCGCCAYVNYPDQTSGDSRPWTFICDEETFPNTTRVNLSSMDNYAFAAEIALRKVDKCLALAEKHKALSQGIVDEMKADITGQFKAQIESEADEYFEQRKCSIM